MMASRTLWRRLWLGCWLLMPATAASAQQPERPSESDLFGPQPGATEAAKAANAAASGSAGEAALPDEADIFAGPQTTVDTPRSARADSGDASRDDRVLGSFNAAPQLSSDVAPPDPLAIGGQVYLRSLSSARQGNGPTEWSFSTPTLVDAYFDARPNERVRAYVLGRMSYDPTLADSAAPNQGVGQAAGTGSIQGSPSLSSLFQSPTRGPRVILDQLWLRFSVKQRLFITAGKQHVRWGTGRFWMPSDFLHIRRRNPLDVFDARAGTTMVKLHLPVEQLGWNFYAYGITESVGATSDVGSVAGAARAEFVLGTSELGLGAFLKRDQSPRLQADISTGIGPFDFYGEVALRQGDEIDRVRYNANAMVPLPSKRPDWQSQAEWEQNYISSAADALYPVTRRNGMKAQAVGGLTYQLQYADKDVFLLGAEYFYNSLGYNDTKNYLGLVVPRNQALVDPATFFYLGRHYGALFASLPSPFNWDLHTFTLSTLGNFSDQSFISRFDYTYILLTHLRFEAFASVRYGQREGEFRFGATFPAALGGFSLPPSVFDCGLALRVAI